MKTAYMIGIKGVGMAALAKYLKESGYEVEGSDSSDIYVTDVTLKEEKIRVFSPFDKINITDKKPDLVIVSAAYKDDNPEVKEAQKKKLNIKYYSEVLGEITKDKRLIAVAGIHGKTTTTSLISLLLKNANFDPNYIIGAANIPVLESNAHFSESDYFVLEADEYRQKPDSLESKFLSLNPEIAIISSIELDHPDMFGSIEDVYQTFYKFACHVKREGRVIINIDYIKSKKLFRSLVDRTFETYGFSDEASWRIIDVAEKEKTVFSVIHNKKTYGPYELSIPGKHNILNAVTAVILANYLNISDSILKKTFLEFRGVQRRFQIIDQVNDITIIDDYAHHPTAITRTLEAAKDRFPDAKIWCIFQPHTFSRTQSLLKEFGSAFSFADKVIITDIYASAREQVGKITAVDLVEEIRSNKVNVQYMSDFDKIKKYLANYVKGKAIILTLGAGDVYKISTGLVDLFKK